MMRSSPARHGFTLVELLLFLGLAAIMATTLVSVYIATQESRQRQRGIAAVEQRGTQILEQAIQNIRRAEHIIDPAIGQSGSTLALQMGLNSEFPTIFGSTASGELLLIQRTSTASLLPAGVTVTDFDVINIDGESARISFELTGALPTIPPSTYVKRFQAAGAVYVDDVSDAGGCSSCPSPSCANDVYTWQYCVSGACTTSSLSMVC
jgi:type II secretory pathway pseudopilin PulG